MILFVKLSYVNTVVPVDTVHTDAPVCMAFLAISLLFKKVKGRGGKPLILGGGLICYLGAFSGESAYSVVPLCSTVIVFNLNAVILNCNKCHSLMTL